MSRKAAAVPPPPAYQGIIANDTSRLQESLFKGDQEVLSNDDIQRILTARITLTDRHRLAVLGLGTRFTYSQALADLDAQNSQRFLQALKSSSRLTEVRRDRREWNRRVGNYMSEYNSVHEY